MKLFTTHDGIMDKYPFLGEGAEDMLDFLEQKLAIKGFGSVTEMITFRPDRGTHDTPIFSGKFKCSYGDAEVKCVHRTGKKKKAHWAVYIKRI